jgi:hypothetical protein
MRTGELDAGLEARLPFRFSAGVRYYRKWLSRAVEDVGIDLPPALSILGNPGDGYASAFPRAARTYDGVELQLRRRLSRGWSMDVRYRWGRLEGNYEGTGVSEGSGRESSNNTPAFDSRYSSYDRFGKPVMGPLPADRRHRLAVNASFTLPFGAQAVVAGVVQSGRPESSEIEFNGYPVFYNGRGDLGRLPAFSQLDLQLRKRFGLGTRRSVLVEATFENVLDSCAPLAYYSNNPYRDGFELPDAAFDATPWDPREWAESLRASSTRIRDELLFRVPNRFQGPRQVTIGIRITF